MGASATGASGAPGDGAMAGAAAPRGACSGAARCESDSGQPRYTPTAATAAAPSTNADFMPQVQPVLAAARTASLSEETPAPAAIPASQRAFTRDSSSAVGSSAPRALAIS